MRKLTLYICALLLLSTSIAQAQSPRFFSQLPDIPLMENMVELKDQTLIFDKAHGRLIESRAIIDNKTPSQITSYYDQSLQSFGWHKQTDSQYQRGEDTIKLSFETIQDSTMVTITLTSSQQ